MGLISSSQALSLDSNIFIAAFDKQNQFHIACKELLSQIKQVSPRVFISVLVFEEFLVQIYRDGLDKNLTFYEDFLTGGGLFTALDFNRSIARRAAQIRAKYPNIKTPDAIHLASALESGAKIFITTDKKLPSKIEKLKIEILK